MKRTLLALALLGATVTTALAAQTIAQDSNGKFSVGGDLKYNHRHTLTDLNNAQGQLLQHNIAKQDSLALNLYFNSKYNINHDEISFYVKGTDTVSSNKLDLRKYNYTTVKDKPDQVTTTIDYHKSHDQARFDFNKIVFSYSKANIGKFTLALKGDGGAVKTLIFGGSKDAVAGYMTAFDLVKGSTNRVLRFRNNQLVSDLTFAVSYGDTKTNNNTSYQTNLEAAMVYDLMGDNLRVGSGLAVTKQYAHQKRLNNNVSLDVFGKYKVFDTQITADLGYAHQAHLSTVVTNSAVASIDISYKKYAIAHPYLGYAYRHSSTKGSGDNYQIPHIVTSLSNFYVGVSSTLCKPTTTTTLLAGLEYGYSILHNNNSHNKLAVKMISGYVKYAF